MTVTITLRDESAVTTADTYRYDRVVDITGRIVRVSIERQRCPGSSFGHVDMLSDLGTWTRIVEDTAPEWWNGTPIRHRHFDRRDAAAALGPIADQLVRRAAAILAPAPTTSALSPHAVDAVSALLARLCGYNGVCHISPDDIAFANTYGGRLHVIEHDDGRVTFTKEHREQCPHITSAGTQECDDECYFEHASDAQRWPAQ